MIIFRLESAEAELSTAMSVLRAKQQRLAETEGQIARLETQYDTSVAEQGALQAAVELTTTRLTRAGNLAATMHDEHKRWESALQVKYYYKIVFDFYTDWIEKSSICKLKLFLIKVKA
jgi:chromosome segregation ATPase